MVDGRFELLEPLGSGGMGTVWRAYDLMLHREVALKEVRAADADGAPGSAAVQRERVLREARALARIGHPNVVAIHHIVDSPAAEHPWIVMELVRGRSLADLLAQGPLAPAHAAYLGRGLLAALRAAHAVGVLHRDIKPANVLLREDGSPVLTDFGIAAIDGMNGLTSTGSVVGSLDYVAPERLQGEEGHPASDLWSLALVMYVAVEGYHPMRRDTTVATLAAVLKGEVPPPERAGSLNTVLRALLTPDPNQRPTLDQADWMLAEAMGAAGSFVPPRFDSAPGQSAPPGYPSGPRSAPASIGSQPGRLDSVPATPQAAWPGPATSGPFAAQANSPQPAPFAPQPSDPMPQRGRSFAPWWIMASFAAAAALVAAVVFWPKSTDSQANSNQPTIPGQPSLVIEPPGGGQPGRTTTAATTGKSADLLTADGIRQAITALEKACGGKEFTEATFYPEYANASVPVTGSTKKYDSYTYRNGVATRQGPGGTRTETGTVRLGDIDWSILPGLLKAADDKLNVPNPTMRYVIVDSAWTFNDDKPTIRVYLSDAYNSTGYLAANLDGTIVSVYASE
ncbi:serine/threonine protein kinase [Nocardia huaxiensis]|uniref:non-specific serine/threonine protein kinase n=1 Tax=Nocardia huaxiensis TaxID=2755382 RepID=A0A7D6ZMG2_9NOCA|nr:serine/threonine protein kinase [Nocardia huaxiensis]